MPEVVEIFANNQDFNEVREIQNKLIATYQQDFSKHSPNKIVPKIRMLWNSIPSQLTDVGLLGCMVGLNQQRILDGNNVIPVEVKAEVNLKSKSLKTYREKFLPQISIRSSPIMDKKNTE